MKNWTPAQKALVVIAFLQLLWALAGFVAEPSFHLGADAPTAKVLGVDFNGYHALSGFLLFLPAFYFARRSDWVFTFPDNASDGIFHLATGTLFAILAAIQLAENRRLSPT